MDLPCRNGLIFVAMALLASGCQQAPQAVQPKSPKPSLASDELGRALQRDDVEVAARIAEAKLQQGDHSAGFVLGFLADIGAGVALDHKKALVSLQQAAAQGNTQACLYLAWKYATGFGLPAPDATVAAHWRNAAATSTPAPPEVPKRWLLASNAGSAPNFRRAFLWMLSRAQDGNVTAEANLATAYLATEWTATDTAQHLYWLRQAADAKDPSSLEQLATYYEAGLLVPQDSAQALAFRRAAAELGSVNAQFALAEQYRNSDGVTTDAVEALKWYRLAAAHGHVEALVKLGDLLRDGAPGVSVDYAESLQCARRAAALGSIEALGDVAGMLREGKGTPPDHATAAKLYEEAAQKGYAYAADMLGWMYQQGELGSPDPATARHWFEQAAGKGNEHAMRQLGIMYRDGVGMPKAPDKAFEWFERAAREGDAWSQNEVGWMLRQGIGIERDDEEAVNWFRLAAKNGEPLGDANLGYHYLHGFGVPRNRIEAATHLIAAARELANNWLDQNLIQAFRGGGAAEQAALRPLLQNALDDPQLMNCRGTLPETLLLILEDHNGTLHDPAAARALLQRLAVSQRPSSLALLATHAFLGQDMECDLERARNWARAVAAKTPQVGAHLLAQIDSVAAPTAAERAAAQATLQQLADTGDRGAAWILAGRLLDGTAGDPNPILAEKYYQIAFANRPQNVSLTTEVHYVMKNPPSDPGSLKALAEKIAKTLATNVDASGVPTDHLSDSTPDDPNSALAAKISQAIHANQLPDSPLTAAAELVADNPTPTPPSPEVLAARMAKIASENRNASDTSPSLIYSTPPSFPIELRASGLEGQAEIEFVVDPTGTPVNVQSVSSSHPLFAASAVTAIKRWRFAPGRKNGKPVATRVRQRVSFDLSSPDSGPSTFSAPPSP